MSTLTKVNLAEQVRPSVKAYGAVGDGVTDDTQAFIDCIAANSLVLIPAGVYLITSTISIPGNTRIIGASGLFPVWGDTTRKSIIKGNFAGSILYILEGVITLSDFVVDGGSAAGSTGIQIGQSADTGLFTAMVDLSRVGVKNCGQNIEVKNAFEVAFHGVKSKDSLGHGLWIHPPTSYPTGRPTINANPPTGGETTTILVDQQSAFDTNAGSGIYLDGYNNTVIISDCAFDNNTLTDLDCVGTGQSLIITNNYIESIDLGLNIAAGYGFTGYDYDATGIINVSGNFFQCDINFNGNPVNAIGNSGPHLHVNTMASAVIDLTDSSTIGVVGPTLIANGDFTGGVYPWGLQTGWSYSSNHIVATNVIDYSSLYQLGIPVTQGALYKIVYTITLTAGRVRAQFSGALAPFRYVSGTYTEYFINPHATGTSGLYFQAVDGFTGTIDTVSVQLVTRAALSGPTYIASETGANNAIAGVLPSGADLAVGMRFQILLAHTLQAGANTMNYGGLGAVAIKSHNNPANNMGTAMAVGAIADLMWDGTQYQNMSQ